jgi:hypothetical protein
MAKPRQGSVVLADFASVAAFLGDLRGLRFCSMAMEEKRPIVPSGFAKQGAS